MAEKSVLGHVEEILTCAMCLEILQDPRTLQCLHSYCLKCLRQLATRNANVEGYNCPQCRRFTASTDTRTIHLVVQLLDAYNAANKVKEGINCDSCKEKYANWICMNCVHDNYQCDSCISYHDKYMRNANQEHEVLSLDEYTNANRVLDRPMYCDKHKGHKLEVFCIQCTQAVCVLCKLLLHNDHSSISVAEAVENTLLEMEKDVNGLENQVSLHTQEVTELKSQLEDTNRGFDEEQRKLEEALEAEIARLKTEQDTKIKIVEEKRRVVAQKTEATIAYKEYNIKEETQLIHWLTTMAKTTGVTLLTEYQENLIAKVRLSLQQDPPVGYHTTRCFPWEINGSDQWKKNSQFQVPNVEKDACTRLSIVWGKICLLNHDSRHFNTYQLDGAAGKSFIFTPNINRPRVVVQVNADYAVLAAASGLYLINSNAQVLQVVDRGDYADVCLSKDQITGQKLVIALEWKSGNLKSYEISNSLKLLKSIELAKYEHENVFQDGNRCNTFVVNEDCIYICMVYVNRVVKYDHSGKRLEHLPQSKGFQSPFLCGIDNKSALMVASHTKKWVGILVNNQYKNILKLSDHSPWYFMFEDENTLWVLRDGGRVHKYIQD